MIFTLWLGKTNEICRSCISSWIKLGYKPIIYTDLNDLQPFFKTIEKDIELKDYKEILDVSIDILLHFTDHFRFKRLYKEGGTWLDADMFLLKKLPEDEIIISTERTNQSGAFKNKIIEIANIGVLRFNKNDKLLEYVLNKIENNKSKSTKIQKNMFYFQNAIHKNTDFNEYLKYLYPAYLFCPVNWCCVKEQYNGMPFKSKFNKQFNTIDEILNKSYGVHLWENISLNKLKIDFSKINENSLFKRLQDIIKDEYIICIPSYRRPQIIKDMTLKLLNDNGIRPDLITIFLKDDIDLQKYREILNTDGKDIYNFIIADCDGIGLTRTFIRNYYPVGQKVIMIDDDIKDICSSRELFNIKDFFNEMFNTMKKENVKFSGCCPYANEYYMKLGYSTNLKYTGGHLIAEIIRENPIEVKEKHFEDYVANIEYFKRDKKLLRFNDVYVKTKYYNPNGGIVSTYGSLDKRKDDAHKLAYELSQKYEGYCWPYLKKKFNVYNLKLNHNAQPY